MLKSIPCPSSRKQARHASPSTFDPPVSAILKGTHENLRQGVRDICARFPNEYWRDLDADRRYPEEFVRAMTEAGYLGALVPEEYGGMGLDLSAACAILEEVNRSGANAGPAHAQIHSGRGPQARLRGAQANVLAEGSERRTEAAGLRRHRAGGRDGYDLHTDHGDARRQPLRRERAQDLHLQGGAVGPHDPARPHHAFQ